MPKNGVELASRFKLYPGVLIDLNKTASFSTTTYTDFVPQKRAGERCRTKASNRDKQSPLKLRVGERKRREDFVEHTKAASL